MLMDLCGEENGSKIPARERFEEISHTVVLGVPHCRNSLERRLEVEGMFFSKPNQLNFVEPSFFFWLFVSVPYIGAVYWYPEMLRDELGVSLVILKRYREVKMAWYEKGFKP